MVTAVYAVLGALIGTLAIYLGLNFHIGSTIYNGLPAYIGSAFTGAVAVLVFRYVIRKQFGPFIL